MLICIEVCQQRLKKKKSTTSLDYRRSAEKRTGNNGNDTGLPQNGAVGHENSIFKGVYVTKRAWASVPKRALLLSSCVTFGKSLGNSEHQLPVFNQEIQFTRIKKIKIRMNTLFSSQSYVDYVKL